MGKKQVLWTVTVWSHDPKKLPLIANFTDEREANDYEWALFHREDIARIEKSPGYVINKTADQALEAFKFWML